MKMPGGWDKRCSPAALPGLPGPGTEQAFIPRSRDPQHAQLLVCLTLLYA